MSKAASIMDLLEGYGTYATPAEMNATAAADAPATSTPCASASASWLSGQVVSKLTVGWSC